MVILVTCVVVLPILKKKTSPSLTLCFLNMKKLLPYLFTKSQGSEFDHISIILPDEAICFQKELLFTAITRAKISIAIYGSFETLISLVKNKLCSSSNLSKKVFFYVAENNK